MGPYKCFAILFLITCLIHLYDAKTREQLVSEKVEQMMSWSNSKPIIRLTGDKFRQYVKTGNRNYSVILLLTALSPQRGCAICSKASEEFTIIANSWRFGTSYTNAVFFALVDFDESPDIFQALKQQTAPVFIHFPPKGNPKKADTMDIQRIGLSAEAISRFVHDRVGVQIRVFRPPDYSGTFALLVLGFTVVGIVYIKRDSLDYLYNTTFWSVLVLIVIFAMLSGQMWNQIRGPPFSHRNAQTGQMHFFNGHSQAQFIAETYIVFILYAATVGGVILLNEADQIKGENSQRKVLSLVGVATFALFFSVILSVFRAKYQGYPYSFLLS